MLMAGRAKDLVKKAFNLAGLDIIRACQNPRHTMLGIKRLPVRTVIDVGANEGQFAKWISSIFSEARIYCFEPLPRPFKALNGWAESRAGMVKTFNAALGDEEGIVQMHRHLEHDTSSSLLDTTNTGEKLYPFTKKQDVVTIKITTLDKAMASLSAELVSDVLLKLDVQGYEDRVIRGSLETLGKTRVCILEVCLDSLYDGQASFIGLLNQMRAMGFRYAGNLEQSYAHDGHVVFLDAVFLKDM